MPLILPGNVASATAATGYTVANSCRFNSGDTAYMHKTQSAGNRKTWTFATWIKRGKLGGNFNWGATQANTTNDNLMPWTFNTSDKINIYDYNSAVSAQLITTQVFRDPSAWFHFVLAVDTEQAVAANRMKMYINGKQVTAFDTETQPAEDYEFNINVNTKRFTFGVYDYGTLGSPADQYYAETIFIDGTQYAASDFGEFDEDSPTIWKPKDPSELTFGTNGFWLDYEASDNLGNDANGGTDLTVVNITAADQATDTPTNNFCVINPADNFYQGATITEGNCKILTGVYAISAGVLGTFGLTSGKWYWETKFVSETVGVSYSLFGIMAEQATSALFPIAEKATGFCIYLNDGKIWNNNATTDNGSQVTLGDGSKIIQTAVDMDNLRIYFGLDGSWGDGSGNWDESAPTTYDTLTAPALTPLGVYLPVFGDWSHGSIGYEVNFGGCSAFAVASANQDANGYGNFEFAVPSGFFSLCTKNLAEYG